MEQERIVTDPLGHRVQLPQELSQQLSTTGTPPRWDEIGEVVRKPALLLELAGETPATQLYYYRSMGWNTTLLLIAKQHNEHWRAIRCIQNPSSELMNELLKTGRQLI